MEKENLISIIIPVYNRQELVKDALDSVLAQTYQAWECIVIDDGSTDDTWAVLEQYAKKDARIKIHKRHRDPKGAPTCRNIGMELSEGEYLMFLDSDDLLVEDCLSYRVDKIELNPNNSAWIFNTGIFHHAIGDSEVIWNKLITENDDVVRFLNQDMPWHTSGPIWKNDNLLKFNESAQSFQDWEFHLRFLIQEQNYFKDPSEKITVYYRKDNLKPSISKNTLNSDQLVNRLEVIFKTGLEISKTSKKHDLDILKLIFRSTRLLKQQGLVKQAFYYWNMSKKSFIISKFDTQVLTLFLYLVNNKNVRALEFLVFRVLKKGYLLSFKSTFLSCIK